MNRVLKVSLLLFALTFLVAFLSKLPHIHASATAEQMSYPSPDSASDILVEESYPSPTSLGQQSPSSYPSPVSGDTSPIGSDDNGRLAQMNEALFEDAKMYAALYGVSDDEAIRRLVLQGVAENLNADLVANEIGSYAGLWIQHEPDYRIIVQFTHDGNSIIKSHIDNSPLVSMIEVRKADVSLEELGLGQTQIAQVMSQSRIPFKTGINVIGNGVELYVISTADAVAYLGDMKISLPDHTRIIKVNELGTEVENIYGGLALTTCTSGFSVINASGIKGVTTAGHCNNQQSFNGIDLPFLAGTQHIPGTTQARDIQWHRADHEFNVVGRIEDGIGGRAILYEKLRDSQVVGGYVCKYGKTSGYGCGLIANVYYDGVNVRVDNITVEPGDSGGPWYLLNTAYGTTISTCTLTDGTPCAIYGPVDQIHNVLGLTLLYRVHLPFAIRN